METQFWLERWKQQQIGFHQSEINHYLIKYWHRVNQDFPDSQVFVPLCGKSTDMLWLQQQGHAVLGIELSELAIHDFFSENDIRSKARSDDRFKHYTTENLNLICGDFFALQSDDLIHSHLVFDRASLVALPLSMRKRYANHLSQVLPQQVRILLVIMEYPQAEMDGPPFSVPETEVFELFEKQFSIQKLETFDIYQANPRFQEKGLSSLKEKVFLLTRD